MDPNTERFRRAMTRGFGVLAAALFAAVVALALIIAPIGSAGAADSSWHPAPAAEFPAEAGDDHDPRGGHTPTADRDDGDDLLAVQPVLAGVITALLMTRAGSRRRGIRSLIGAAPRGPPVA